MEVDEVDPAAAASSMIGSLTIDDFFDDFASQIEWGGADYYYKGSLDSTYEVAGVCASARRVEPPAVGRPGGRRRFPRWDRGNRR